MSNHNSSRPPPPGLKRPSLSDALSEARAIAGGQSSRPPPPPAESGVRRILLVDPDATFRSKLAAELRPFCEVLEAGDGLAAAEACSLGPAPTFVVTDVAMPKLDGFALIKLLKGHPTLKNVSFAFLSAKAAPQDVMTGIGLGARQFMQKATMPEMVAKIRKLAGV